MNAGESGILEASYMAWNLGSAERGSWGTGGAR
ncbi:MAG: hypothetical protein RL309_1682 [Verrucomicrobiota bacterium]